MTGLGYIASALRLIGKLAGGQTPSGPDATDGLVILNGMIDAWATEDLTIYFVGQHQYPFVANQAFYTIGPGGDFDQARPIYIDRASVVMRQNPAQPVEVPIRVLTLQEVQQIPVKTVQSQLPMGVYYDRGFTNGRGQLQFIPVPTQNNVSAKLYTYDALTAFVNLIADYEVPPGYNEAIKYNLADRLAPEYGVDLQRVAPRVLGFAVSSLANIKRVNRQLVELEIDPALLPASGGFYNWLTGQTQRR